MGGPLGCCTAGVPVNVANIHCDLIVDCEWSPLFCVVVDDHPVVTALAHDVSDRVVPFASQAMARHGVKPCQAIAGPSAFLASMLR